MKKTLIALAAVAVSTGAMAQATISGVVDFGAVSNGKVSTKAASGGTTQTNVKTSGTSVQNPWTTSAITFRASEDLGGGLTAAATITSAAAGGALGQREQFLTLSGGFGSVQLGRFIPAGSAGQYGFDGARTANSVGATYQLSSAATNSNFSSGLAAGSFERQDNVLQYTSPNFNGFTAAVAYVNNSSDSDATTAAGKGQTTQTGLNISYATGALRIGAGMSERTVKREAVGARLGFIDNITGAIGAAATVPSSATADTQFDIAAVEQRSIKGSLDYIGASYDFGVATVFGTHAKRKDQTSDNGAAYATNADIKLNAIGVNVPMGAITLAASTYTGKDKRGTGNTDDTKLSGNQLSVTYALSKRTNIYALTGKAEFKRNGAASNVATRKTTATAVGLAHSF